MKTHTFVYIIGAVVEKVNSFTLLGINTTENLSDILVKKAQKQLHFLRKLKEAKFLCHVPVHFYEGAIRSILTQNIANWHHEIYTVQENSTAGH